jgi:hypothetical protein
MLAAQSSPVGGFVFVVAVLATSIVLVAALAWASRQLLGLPVGTLRAFIAGLLGAPGGPKVAPTVSLYLGLAFTRELVRRGAAKVYGAARDPGKVTEPGVQPVALDITDGDQVERAGTS